MPKNAPELVLPPLDSIPSEMSPTVEVVPSGTPTVDEMILKQLASGSVSLPGIVTGVVLWIMVRYGLRYLRKR